MALPKPARPEYSTTIPSTGKKIKYQPFSVKEEKILVLAAESEEPDEMANAVTNILNNCITSPPDLDVSTLALFDVEYLFLKARLSTPNGKHTLKAITIIDPASSWIKNHKIPDKQSVTCAEIFDRQWLCCYPRPQGCIHDNSTEFTGSEFQELLTSYRIKDKPTTEKIHKPMLY